MPEQEHPSGQDRPSGPEHPSEGELRALVAGQLPAARSEQVMHHLDDCEQCTESLESLEPRVTIDDPDDASMAAAGDDRSMRRAVRRTLLRTAVDVVALLGITALAVVIVSTLVWHPLIVDRGDRVERDLQASLDLPVLTIPGAQVEQWRSNPGVWRRHTEVDVHRLVGVTEQELGTQESWLGPFGSSQRPVTMSPKVGVDGQQVAFDPDRLGDGTAVSVEVVVDGLAVDDADAVVDDGDPVALTWVGFDVPSDGPPGYRPTIGYSACRDVTGWQVPSGGAGVGGSFGARGPGTGDGGVGFALEQTRRALDNLAASGLDLDPGPSPAGTTGPAATARQALHEEAPTVSRLVVTGPTDAVADVVDRADPDQQWLLGVDHDLTDPEDCG